ncbi:MAG: hypothetical protein JWP48_7511 [Actinoallomurus sp.]|jgi:uncharacterized protein (UPF0548 family)|nr:hypothetical protein [Actinoallomurus sp.]
MVNPTTLPADVVRRLRDAGPTYAEVGSTAGVLPPGYRHVSRTVRVGSGIDVFDMATEAVLTWQVHLRAGLRVAASSPRVERGSVVRLGLGPVRLSVPCVVVYTVDEPRRRGFAYGTLPGHPERGEESFIVERRSDDTVDFTVTAFSRPATLPAKAAGPAGLAVQHWLTRRYLRALAGKCADHERPPGLVTRRVGIHGSGRYRPQRQAREIPAVA